MNVLLTSAGRRSYLVHYFKAALAGKGKVIAANMFSNAPAMYAADAAITCPPSHSPDYIDFLLDACREYDIRLLCSLHDLDTYVLSQHRHRFELAGVTTTLPDSQWGRLALDKYRCTEAFLAASIPTPWTTLHVETALEAVKNNEIRFPLVVKSRFGFGSQGLRLCKSADELALAYQSCIDEAIQSGAANFIVDHEGDLALIQSAIAGSEVCLGICNDFSGAYRAHFACEVHSMRAGESDSATSIDRHPLQALARNISELTRHVGIWGIDLMNDQGTLRAIDVNPRFTGDYPFHHLAGADIPAALIAWAEGKEPSPACFTHNPGITGYKDIVPKSVAAPS